MLSYLAGRKRAYLLLKTFYLYLHYVNMKIYCRFSGSLLIKFICSFNTCKYKMAASLYKLVPYVCAYICDLGR